MDVTLLSFGFDHGVPDGVDLIVDCRALHNPYAWAAQRGLTGLDADVQDDLKCHLAYVPTVRFLRQIIEQGRIQGWDGLVVGLGCTEGVYRSVGIAESVAERLRRDGLWVEVQHRDLPWETESLRRAQRMGNAPAEWGEEVKTAS